jgi:hypothetical protein
MKFSRYWEMPNSNTFEIQRIRKFIGQYLSKDIISIDPFANNNRFAKITNDIDPEMKCDFNLDAYDFCKTFENNSIDLVLFDPPYSSRQVAECYKKVGRTVNMETTQGSFWSNIKNEIARIVKPNGIVLCFGWNSNGIGKVNGFEFIEILLVSHGGVHNDTICTAEYKRNTIF